MKPRLRFIVVLLAVFLAAAFCGARLRADDHAKPRDRSRGGSKTEHRRDTPPPQARQPERSQSQDRERARSDDAQRRHPQPRAEERREEDTRRRDADRNRNDNRGRDNDRDRPGLSDAQRRHSQPDGRYDRGRDNRSDWNRYNWRGWNNRNRYDRDRFPRFYFGLNLFGGLRYRGYTFGPHYRMWHLSRGTWQLFYWPYPYAPLYGCREYLVPTDRQLVYDPATGEEYWDYTDYQRIFLCFD